ncbi:uncharacterized protein LOC142769115 [Rhipicephalus microplus]|uniref:uncharacterized protein LOC142769115 n=1 Tax=Rhipicephalus microplus TaxID=6941 RepID=UPI003F6B8A51
MQFFRPLTSWPHSHRGAVRSRDTKLDASTSSTVEEWFITALFISYATSRRVDEKVDCTGRYAQCNANRHSTSRQLPEDQRLSASACRPALAGRHQQAGTSCC